VMGYTVYRDSIVTMSWGNFLTLKSFFIMILGLLLLS